MTDASRPTSRSPWQRAVERPIRVRQAKLKRFTVDRLVGMLTKLNQDVELSVSVQPRRSAAVTPAVV